MVFVGVSRNRAAVSLPAHVSSHIAVSCARLLQEAQGKIELEVTFIWVQKNQCETLA